ncbi:MAG: hypothetical protein GY938_13325 [Ketobacter sp.]|nr:hypothetical protein [Ketobacter sp.]
MDYKHTEDMGEISGFGGGYEATCQQMLHNGVAFLHDHPNADARVMELRGKCPDGEEIEVYGICDVRGDDAEAIESAVMDGIDDCTGAMHQAVMSRLMWINENGWDAYCEELRKPVESDGEVKE